MSGLITLTTDFGNGSSYVAQMKGVILAVNPQATIIDITHDIAPQDIRGANYILDEASVWYPENTIHVVVVDPGVGTQREIIYARIGTHHFVAPNNGLLTLVARRTKPERVAHVTRQEYWHHPVSSTFHGRDIMAPVAAHLSLGLAASELGAPFDNLLTLDLPRARFDAGQIHGEVIAIDDFGNLITNVGDRLLSSALAGQNIEVQTGDHRVAGVFVTYGEGASGEPLALIGSSGRLEIAVSNGNAAAQLGIDIGTTILVRPRHSETDHD